MFIGVAVWIVKVLFAKRREFDAIFANPKDEPCG